MLKCLQLLNGFNFCYNFLLPLIQPQLHPVSVIPSSFLQGTDGGMTSLHGQLASRHLYVGPNNDHLLEAEFGQ
jgi:hypothetical protein